MLSHGPLSTNNARQQKLQDIAIGVANGFGDPAYVDAANALRLPYWDWVQAVPAGVPVVPTALSTPTVSVTLRDGSTRVIQNPLYDYDFHPLDRMQINSTVSLPSIFSAALRTRDVISVPMPRYAIDRGGQSAGLGRYRAVSSATIMPSIRICEVNSLAIVERYTQLSRNITPSTT